MWSGKKWFWRLSKAGQWEALAFGVRYFLLCVESGFWQLDVQLGQFILFSVGLSSLGAALLWTRWIKLGLFYSALPLEQKEKQVFREHDKILAIAGNIFNSFLLAKLDFWDSITEVLGFPRVVTLNLIVYMCGSYLYIYTPIAYPSARI